MKHSARATYMTSRIIINNSFKYRPNNIICKFNMRHTIQQFCTWKSHHINSHMYHGSPTAELIHFGVNLSGGIPALGRVVLCRVGGGVSGRFCFRLTGTGFWSSYKYPPISLSSKFRAGIRYLRSFLALQSCTFSSLNRYHPRTSIMHSGALLGLWPFQTSMGDNLNVTHWLTL